MERSADDLRLLADCWLGGDESTVKSLLIEQPGLADIMSEAYRRQVSHAARNNNLAAVRLMLAAGLPATTLGQHGAIPLHWAGFHGNVEMAREILRYHPPLEMNDADFHLSPLGWAIYGSQNAWPPR